MGNVLAQDNVLPRNYLPTYIQQKIIIFEYIKPKKVKWIELKPDLFWIAEDYLSNEKQDKYWYRKFKLIIRF